MLLLSGVGVWQHGASTKMKAEPHDTVVEKL